MQSLTLKKSSKEVFEDPWKFLFFFFFLINLLVTLDANLLLTLILLSIFFYISKKLIVVAKSAYNKFKEKRIRFFNFYIKELLGFLFLHNIIAKKKFNLELTKNMKNWGFASFFLTWIEEFSSKIVFLKVFNFFLKKTLITGFQSCTLNGKAFLQNYNI